jgi:O-antigen/teichoic acid export membrane protein
MIFWLSLAILAIMLLAVGIGTLFWRRLYRDDATNVARRALKNSGVTFALRLVVRALDMVFFYVLLGSLPAVEIAPYTLAALLVSQYLATFTEFGLGVLLTREVARDPTAARRLFGVTLALRLLLVLCAAAPAALLVIGLYSGLGNLGLSDPLTAEGQLAIWILLLTLVPSAYSGAVTALYNASERMEVPALIEVVTGVLAFAARIAVIILGGGIIGLAWVAVAVSCCTAAVFWFLQGRDFFPPRLGWDRSALQQLVPLAFPLMLNNLLSAVFFRFDLFIIRAFGGPGSDLLVQQYNMPYTVLNIALILPPTITFAVFPALARRAEGDPGAMRAAQDRTLQAMLLLAFPLAMGLAMLAPALVLFFTRDEVASYGSSATILAILAWFLPLSFVNGLIQYVLIARNQQRAITGAFLVGAVFNLLANLLAMPLATLVWQRPEYGLYAAAAITIASEVVLLAVFWPLLRKADLAPPLFSLSWRPALACLAMGALMWLPIQFIGGWWGPALATLIAPPAYGLALWVLGTFGVEERALVMRVLGR